MCTRKFLLGNLFLSILFVFMFNLAFTRSSGESESSNWFESDDLSCVKQHTAKVKGVQLYSRFYFMIARYLKNKTKQKQKEKKNIHKIVSGILIGLKRASSIVTLSWLVASCLHCFFFSPLFKLSRILRHCELFSSAYYRV